MQKPKPTREMAMANIRSKQVLDAGAEGYEAVHLHTSTWSTVEPLPIEQVLHSVIPNMSDEELNTLMVRGSIYLDCDNCNPKDIEPLAPGSVTSLDCSPEQLAVQLQNTVWAQHKPEGQLFFDGPGGIICMQNAHWLAMLGTETLVLHGLEQHEDALADLGHSFCWAMKNTALHEGLAVILVNPGGGLNLGEADYTLRQGPGPAGIPLLLNAEVGHATAN